MLSNDVLDEYVGEHDVEDSEEPMVVWKDENGRHWVHHPSFGTKSLKHGLLSGLFKGE